MLKQKAFLHGQLQNVLVQWSRYAKLWKTPFLASRCWYQPKGFNLSTATHVIRQLPGTSRDCSQPPHTSPNSQHLPLQCSKQIQCIWTYPGVIPEKQNLKCVSNPLQIWYQSRSQPIITWCVLGPESSYFMHVQRLHSHLREILAFLVPSQAPASIHSPKAPSWAFHSSKNTGVSLLSAQHRAAATPPQPCLPLPTSWQRKPAGTLKI